MWAGPQGWDFLSGTFFTHRKNTATDPAGSVVIESDLFQLKVRPAFLLPHTGSQAVLAGASSLGAAGRLSAGGSGWARSVVQGLAPRDRGRSWGRCIPAVLSLIPAAE